MGTRAWTLLLGLLALSACDFPRDGDGTLERVRKGGELRVGVSEEAPWVRFEGDEPRGIEPALIHRWADQLGAHIRWVRGSQADLVEALDHHEIDVLAAGFTDETPWEPRLGLSRPYLTAALRVGRSEDAPLLDEWKGRAVTVPPGDARLAALVRKKGGLPVTSEAPFRAGYEFQLANHRLVGLDPALADERHVLAVTPGENALLLALDRFLQSTGRDALPSITAEEAQ